tara:strand:+ start:8009 stop:8311 length:303 start_codon:yes stop_codon:yes gene_type:complete
MKHAKLSILVALLGILFLGYINWLVWDTLTTYNENAVSEMAPHLVVTPRVFKISALIIGLIGIFFGIKGVKINKKISVLGIVLSILVCIFSFVPFWYFFV